MASEPETSGGSRDPPQSPRAIRSVSPASHAPLAAVSPPPQTALSAHIESTHTPQDDHLDLAKPTSAPQNTPADSPEPVPTPAQDPLPSPSPRIRGDHAGGGPPAKKNEAGGPDAAAVVSNDVDNKEKHVKEEHVTKMDNGDEHLQQHQHQQEKDPQQHQQQRGDESLQLPHISTLLALSQSAEGRGRGRSSHTTLGRRSVFATSASRCPSSEGTLPDETAAAAAVAVAGAHARAAGGGMLTPNRLFFNNHRSATDPHASPDKNYKINISSLLNSRGEDVYTLRSQEDPSSSPVFTGLVGSEDAAVAPPTSQPRFINSKLDEVRSRVLLDPNSQARPQPAPLPGVAWSLRGDDDSAAAGAAAAIITKMRSSPYATHDESGSSSRPGSASFRHHMRPVVRIHQREYEPDDSDENAVIEDDTEDELLDEYQRRGSDKISWNKSGMKKRVTRRQSAPSSNVKRRHSSYNDYSKRDPRDSRHSSVSSTSTVTSLLSAAALLGKVPPTHKDENRVKNNTKHKPYPADHDPTSPKDKPRRKNNSGSRSRTGCWICRLRKKKCTEEKPSCHNCLRLNLQCFYDHTKPDFISDASKKNEKLEEIKKKTKEAKRMAMRRKP